MATYYIDPISGNDGNTGLSFAQRWASFVGKTLSAGDECRVIASPDPTSLGINVTFTNLSPTLTLASALTANIATCDSAWTGSANVTATVSSAAGQYKEGTGAAQLVIAAAFTTGKVAYFDLGSSTDFSAYQQVSMWFTASGSMATNNWSIRLCSDAIGDVAVNTLSLPSGLGNSGYHAVTLNNGAALGSNIRSIALYTAADPGAITVRIDNVIACKDASANDSLTLNSLIGKNTAGETFYLLQSINGTTVIIGGSVTITSGSANLRGYVGTTETVTGYKREGLLLTTNGSQTTSNFGLLTNSGTQSAPITISGGWNRTDMSTQTGETWLLQSANSNVAFRATSAIQWVNFSKIRAVQFYAGFWFTNCSNLSFSDCQAQGNFAYGFILEGTGGNNTLSSCRGDLNGSYGLVLSSNNIVTTCTANGNANTGVYFSAGNNVLRTISSINNTSLGVDFVYNSNNIIYDLTTNSNGVAGIQNYTGLNTLVNASIGETVEVNSINTFSDGLVYSQTHDQTTNNAKIFMDGGLISSEIGSERDSSPGIAWKFEPLSANRISTYPMILGKRGDSHGIKIYCVANYTVNVSVRAKVSNANIIGQLVCRGGQIAGVTNDVTASTSGSTGVYETLTISFTPTANGWIDVERRAYTTDGVTTYNCYFDTVRAY